MNGYSFGLQQARSIRLTPSLRQAIEALSMSNRHFADFLVFRAQTNPFLDVRLSRSDAGKEWTHTRSRSPRSKSGQGVAFPIENVVQAPQGLLDHVWAQAAMVLRNDHERRIGVCLVEALEPSGWLGRPLDEIADETGSAMVEVEAVLRKLHQLEPPGIFARTLAECLTLQAVEAELLDPVMECVLGNLELIASGRLIQLAQLCGSTTEEVADRLRVIRSFNPKPGAAFGDPEELSITPDLSVTRNDSAWVVDIRNPLIGAISIRSAEEVAEGRNLSAAERSLLEEARTVQRAAERRDGTMLKVAAEIVRLQDAFLRDGPRFLLPLRLADIAEAAGVHESTVSRITSCRFIATPRGVLPLRDFFSKSLGEGNDGRAISASAVQEEIRTMVNREDSSAPLSDQRIAELLKERGYPVARRTVAKYRERLGLQGSAARGRAHTLAVALKRRR